MKHISVLRDEIVENFSLVFRNLHSQHPPILIDCTIGFGGHTLAFLQRYPQLEVWGFDRDSYALSLARDRLKEYSKRVHFIHSPFSQALSQIPDSIKTHICGIIADIGVSSMQLDETQRGFSFYAPTLDMRMDSQSSLTAEHIINTYSVAKLEEIFRIYGEFRQSKKLAHIIKEERQKAPIASCQELSQLIEKHFPRKGGIHPATLPFQALRIEVNNELEELQALLKNIEIAHSNNLWSKQNPCYIGIISFHSLEDSIIKQHFKQWGKSCICPPQNYKCECGNTHARGRILHKKPITPSIEEIKHNPRARSAKLRIFALGG